MVKVCDEPAVKRTSAVNLSGHHAQCETNYHLCMALVPDCRQGRNQWSFAINGHQPVRIQLAVIEMAPYTTTLDLVQLDSGHSFLQAPRIRIRLYHDANMAEVVAWNHHRHWQPVYDYPNAHMYQRDEKLVLNRFLGEWLAWCRKLGIEDENFCEKSRINGS